MPTKTSVKRSKTYREKHKKQDTEKGILSEKASARYFENVP